MRDWLLVQTNSQEKRAISIKTLYLKTWYRTRPRFFFFFFFFSNFKHPLLNIVSLKSSDTQFFGTLCNYFFLRAKFLKKYPLNLPLFNRKLTQRASFFFFFMHSTNPNQSHTKEEKGKAKQRERGKKRRAREKNTLHSYFFILAQFGERF